MSNVKSITRDRRKDNESDTDSNGSIVSISTLTKTAKRLLEEDTKGQFDATVPNTQESASLNVEVGDMASAMPPDAQTDVVQVTDVDTGDRQQPTHRNKRPQSLVDYLRGHGYFTPRCIPTAARPRNRDAADRWQESKTSAPMFRYSNQRALLGV